MAGPGRSFYINNFPKPSDYLHYWFSNSDVNVDINALIHQNAQVLIGEQLAKFKAQQSALKATVASMGNNSTEQNTLLELFDLSTYNNEELENILAPQVNSSNEEKLSPPASIEDALAKFSALRSSKAEDSVRLLKFKEAVEEIVNAFDPTGKYKGVLTRIKNSLWNQYTAQALARGKITESEMTAQQQTETARQLIRDILSRNNEKFFDNVQTKDQKVNNIEIDKAVKKLLLLTSALENFGDEGLGISSAIVGHQGRKSTTAASENAVLNALISKVRGMVNYLKGSLGELATVYGFLRVHADALPSFEKGLKVTPKHFGSQYFQIDVTPLENNNTFLKVLENINKTINDFSGQVSKADAGYTISKNGVEANVGFSVKVGGKLNNVGGDPQGSASITLQGGTSLAVLLAREMGLSGAQYQSVIQLLAGHGSAAVSDTALDVKWDALKEQLLKLAFVDVLTGSSIGGKASFMVVGGSIISMGAIIENMMYGNNLSLSMMQRSGKSEISGSLDRGDYTALNTWYGDSGPNTSTALSRSNAVFGAIANLLYQTKINISLNIANLANFKGL